MDVARHSVIVSCGGGTVTVPLGFTIHHLPEVKSTQDEAWSCVQAGARSGTVVMADRQTEGRGRQGRVWEMPIGNLAATLAWHIDPSQERAGDYSLLVAAALHQTTSKYLTSSDDLKIKWPNDLLLHGLKCAGILLEAPAPDWILIGTGVNIVGAPPGRAALAAASSVPPKPADLLSAFLVAFQEWVDVYRTQGLAPIIKAWSAAAFGIGQRMVVRLPNTEFAGFFHGLDLDGACQVLLPEGKIRRVYAGEVFFEPAPPS